jgi:hypothetical protein
MTLLTRFGISTYRESYIPRPAPLPALFYHRRFAPLLYRECWQIFLLRLNVMEQREHVFRVLVLGEEGVDKNAGDACALDLDGIGGRGGAQESRAAVAVAVSNR